MKSWVDRIGISVGVLGLLAMLGGLLLMTVRDLKSDREKEHVALMKLTEENGCNWAAAMSCRAKLDELCLAVQAGAWMEKDWREPCDPKDTDGARHETSQIRANQALGDEAIWCDQWSDRWVIRTGEIAREGGWR